MSEFTTSDPNLINQAVSQLDETPEAEIKTAAPSDSDVTLPGGFLSGDGSVVKYAEVRELTGSDEEAIAKAGSVGRALLVMLQRGLVSIGVEEATKDSLDRLLGGDRDAILVAIRRITFGDEINFSTICQNCRAELEVTLDLATDIPYKYLEDPLEDRKFVYKSKKHGEIKVSLPNGVTQKRLLENADKTVAELNTILLSGCVTHINGMPSVGASSVLSLGMKDREALVEEILKRNPGPRLGEVKTTCEACGEDLPLPMSLADLFRL